MASPPARALGGRSSPGILRLRSQVLPTEAMGGAWRFLVMLSFTRPSPNTLIVNGLPVCTQHL